MSKGPCLCGDTECPSCGPLQGNPGAGEPDPYYGPDHDPLICLACPNQTTRAYSLCERCNKDYDAYMRDLHCES